MATLDPMASAKAMEVKSFRDRQAERESVRAPSLCSSLPLRPLLSSSPCRPQQPRGTRRSPDTLTLVAQADFQAYKQPDSQAELEPIRAYLSDMNNKLDGEGDDAPMKAFALNGCKFRFAIEEAGAAAQLSPMTLLGESSSPPVLDVTVGAEAADVAPHWEWLAEDGKWQKYAASEQALLQKLLADGGGSATFPRAEQSYTIDMSITGGGPPAGFTPDVEPPPEPAPGPAHAGQAADYGVAAW